MKKTETKIIGDYLLTEKVVPMSFISYEVELKCNGKEKYINNIKIIAGGRILKKFRPSKRIPAENSIFLQNAIIEELFFQGGLRDRKIEPINKSKNTDSDARHKAACNLFSDLGLKY